MWCRKYSIMTYIEIVYLITVFFFIFHGWVSISYSKILIRKTELSHDIIMRYLLNIKISKCRTCEIAENKLIAEERMAAYKEKL